MEKGRIVFLNGVTSAGKSSIAQAMHNQSDVLFYVLANDTFQQMIGPHFLRQNYWKHLSDAITLMYQTAKLFADRGNHVLIDGILLEQPEMSPHYERLLSILKDNPPDIVEVYCPLDICRLRNIARGDRYETQSEEQQAMMAKDVRYRMRVDTSVHTPDECARLILRDLFGI